MATQTITWTDPAADVQGNPLPAGTTINIFQAPNTTPIGNVPLGIQTFTTGPLAPGTYQYTLDTVDAEGTSVMTSPVSAVVAPALPNPPTNVAVVTNA